MGIMERVKIFRKNMTEKQKIYSTTTLNNLNKRSMGEFFKAIFAFEGKKSKFLSFN